MIKYTVMMGIRVACIVALLFAKGWWILVFAAGAVFLPYFAVVVANVATTKPSRDVERPGAIVPVAPTQTWTSAESTGSAAGGEPGARPQGEAPPAEGAPDEGHPDDDHPEGER